jgi:hypothetical protein
VAKDLNADVYAAEVLYGQLEEHRLALKHNDKDIALAEEQLTAFRQEHAMLEERIASLTATLDKLGVPPPPKRLPGEPYYGAVATGGGTLLATGEKVFGSEISGETTHGHPPKKWWEKHSG